MSRVKKELKEFLDYKKNYKFVLKELTEKDNCIYCEDELLQDNDGNKISETENGLMLDIGIEEIFHKCFQIYFHIISNLGEKIK